MGVGYLIARHLDVAQRRRRCAILRTLAMATISPGPASSATGDVSEAWTCQQRADLYALAWRRCRMDRSSLS